jgi:hypothetical protein
MSPHERDLTPHPESLLLPWYENDALPPEELARVEMHIKSCAACRDELESQRLLKASYRTIEEQSGNVSPLVFKAVMKQVQSTSIQSRSSLLDGIERTCRALLAPKWAPTAAVALIGLQLGLLVLVPKAPPSPLPVETRSIPQAAPRMRVTFNPSVSLEAVSLALRNVDGRIVEGPAVDGSFIVEFAPGDVPASQRLKALQARTDLVTRLEPAL